MLKAILFDYGGTLTPGSIAENFVLALSRETGVPATWLRKVFEQHNHAYLLGRMTGKKFWTLYAQHTGVQKTPLQLIRLFNQAGRADPARLAVVRTLHKRYKTALISDNYPELSAFITKRYHLEKLFDVLVFSNKEGVRKPDPRIFTRTLKRLGVKSSECVFIDDKKRIVATARRIGIKSILFQGEDKLKNSLKKVGYEGL